MTIHWKPLEVVVPTALTARQVQDAVHAQVRIIATEAGDSVDRISIGVALPHSEGWRK